MEQHCEKIAVLLSLHLIYWFTPPTITTINGIYTTALSFNMEKRRQSPLPHLWRMGHFFFVLYVSILSFSQKACFCHF